MATEAEVLKAREWCEKARQLLGLISGGRKHGNRLDVALERIGKDLKRFGLRIASIREPGDKQREQVLLDGFTDRYVEIGELANKAQASKVNEMAQIVSERMEILRFELQRALEGDTPESREGLEAAQRLMREHALRYQGRYETMLAEAQQQRRELLALNRPKRGDAYEKPVADAIGRATDLAREQRYSEAIGELMVAEKKHGEQLKKAEQDRAASLRSARDKPVYESQHEAVTLRLARLAGMPGTREVHARLAQAVQQIALAAGQGTPYRKAFELLVAFEGPLAQAEQGSAQFEQTADGALDGLLSAAREAVKRLDTLVGLAQPEQVRSHEQAISAALKKHDAQPPQTNTAKNELRTVTRQATEAVSAATLERQKYERDIDAVSTLVDELQSRSGLDAFQPLLAAFRQASAEFAAQQYEAAARTLAALKVEAEKVKREVDPLYLRWMQLLAEITQDLLPALLKASEGSNDALKGASTAYAAFLGARDYTAAVQHDYAAAVLVGEDLKTKVGADDNAGWRKVLLDLEALGDLRDEATRAAQRVRERIQALEQLGGDTAAFGERLSRLVNAWEADCDKTIDRAAVGVALDKLKQGLDPLFNEVDAVITNPLQLGSSKQAATAARHAAEFRQVKAAVDKLMHWLAQEYPGETAAFTLRLGQAEVQLVAQPVEALAAARQLALDVQARIDEKARAVTLLRAEAVKKAQGFLDRVNPSRDKNPRIAKAFDPVTHQLQALMGLADSTVLAVVQDAKRQLDGFQTEYDKFTTQTNAIIDKLLGLAEKLEDKSLKSRAPHTHALLDARLNQEIPGRCGDDPAQALAKVLTPFEQEVDKAIDAATKAGLALERIKLLANKLDGEAGKLGSAPQLMADFKARVKAARTPEEGREQAAEKELERLELLINAANTNPELAAGLEQGVRQRAFEAEQARNDWEAQAELFELREKKAAAAQHSRLAEFLGLSTRNELLYDEMESAFSDAKNLAKRGDYDRALARLADARRLARQYAENPDGAQVSAKKQLAKVVARWRAAAAGFVREMNLLIDDVRSKCLADPIYSAQADSIVAPLRTLAVAFDAGAFDTAVGKLDNKDIGARRAAKEEALRPLRRFQGLLAADPVLPLLPDSPFAKVSVKALREAARDLEVNLLRA